MSRTLSAHACLCGWLVLLFLPALSGCSRSTGSVTGKVLYRGEPLTSGAVIFHGADGRIESGNIDHLGNYVIARAPAGPVKVAVVAGGGESASEGGKAGGKFEKPSPKHPGAGSAPPAPNRKVLIPEKYRNPDQSGLTYTVTPGTQTFNLNLD